MSSVTSLTPLPYPDPTDQPFVHLDLKALAEATTEGLYVAAAASPAHKAGRRWFDTVNKLTYVSDGTRWLGGPVQITTGNLGTVTTTEQQIGATLNIPAGKYLLRMSGTLDFSSAGVPTFEARIKNAATVAKATQVSTGGSNGKPTVFIEHYLDTPTATTVSMAMVLTGALGGTHITQLFTFVAQPVL